MLEVGFEHFSIKTFNKLSGLFARLPKLKAHVVLKNCFGTQKISRIFFEQIQFNNMNNSFQKKIMPNQNGRIWYTKSKRYYIFIVDI